MHYGSLLHDLMVSWKAAINKLVLVEVLDQEEYCSGPGQTSKLDTIKVKVLEQAGPAQVKQFPHK